MLSIAQSVPASALEPGLKATTTNFKAYFQYLDRDSVILLCAKLSQIVADGYASGAPDAHQSCALRLLRSDGIIDETDSQRLNLYLKLTKGPVVVIARQHLFELLRWACAWAPKTGESYRWTGSARKAVFRALLMAHDLYSQREQHKALTSDGGDVEKRRSNVRKLMRLSALLAPSTRFPLVHAGRAKALLINNFFKRFPQYEKMFLELTGISPEEYVECVCSIMVWLGDPSRRKLDSLAGAFEFTAEHMYVNAPHMRETLEKYLRIDSQDCDSVAEGFMQQGISDPTTDALYFKHIREKPIVTNGSQYVVLDQLLFAEKASVGPLFLLMAKANHNQILQDFGAAFERYVEELLSSFENRLPSKRRSVIVVEPAGHKAAARKQKRPFGDFYVRRETTALLIEVKGVFLPDFWLAANDPDEFWTAINRLYGVSENNGKEKRKGIAQLADSIKGLANGDLIPEGTAETLKDCRTIIPVLAVHDGLMNAPYFEHYLCKDFCSAFGLDSLPTSGYFNVGSIRTSAPVLLTVWDLELLESISRAKSLVRLFTEYVEKNPLRASTFADFLREGIRSRTLKRNLSMPAIAGTTVLDEIERKFFRAHE